jgi:hypothetical protein
MLIQKLASQVKLSQWQLETMKKCEVVNSDFVPPRFGWST